METENFVAMIQRPVRPFHCQGSPPSCLIFQIDIPEWNLYTFGLSKFRKSYILADLLKFNIEAKTRTLSNGEMVQRAGLQVDLDEIPKQEEIFQQKFF